MAEESPGTGLIEDVTLRDGLQGEDRCLSVREKVWLLGALVEAGIRRIQVGSFVHPDKVPQMANTEELCRYLSIGSGVTFTALVLNETGLERALKAGMRHLYTAISATETHNLENNHCTLREARQRIERMILAAKANGITVRAGIMMAFGCAFEGPVAAERVLDIARQYAHLGVDIIDLADTAGMATPRQAHDLVTRIRGETKVPISLHLHGTREQTLENTRWGLRAGAVLFDASLAGLGGCPFIPNAAGNLDTEAAVRLLEDLGMDPGIDAERLRKLRQALPRILGRPVP